MSQEYTEDKNITLSKLSNGRRILEAVLLVIAVFAVYLMAALISFDASDPSWSQTSWHVPIHNWGGSVGAWMADTLFFIFGVLSYAIPPIMLCLCWAAFSNRERHDYIDYFSLTLRLIGTLALIFTSCGLAALNFDDLYNFASGGVLGSLLSTAMTPWFNNIGATLALLCLWAVGVTLFTGWSWLVIAEKIGGVVLGTAAFITNRSRHDDENYDEQDGDEYEDLLSEQKSDTSQTLPLGAAAASLAASAKAAADELELDEDDDVLFSAPSLNDAITARPVSDAASAAENIVIPANEDPNVEPPLSTQSLLSSNESQLSSTHQDVIQPTVVPAIPEPVQPPLYRFEIPEEPPIPSHLNEPAMPAADVTIEDDGPRMGNWAQVTESSHQSAPSGFSALQPGGTKPDSSNVASLAASATLAATAGLAKAESAAASNLFMPVFNAAGDTNSQVKKGVGPELPRPNPVRLPTRREMASYGIKLPSQRLAEQQEKALLQKAQENHHVVSQSDEDNAAEIEQAALAQAFTAQQQQRYSEMNTDVITDESINNERVADEDLLQQEQLRQAFAVREHARYQTDESHGVHNESTDHHKLTELQKISEDETFNFSPLADLVDATPAEPLFTLPAQLEASEHVESQSVNRVNAEDQDGNTQDGNTQTIAPTHLQDAAPAKPAMDSLIHPFLIRNDQPLSKPTTPLPSLDLLSSPPAENEPVDMFALEQTAQLIEARLNDYRIKAEVVDKLPGPVITRFELDLAPGVKAARISNLSRDLARSLSTVAVRIVEVIPGKPYVGLELPNKRRQTVYLREVLDCVQFKESPSPLTVVLGKDIAGEPVVADLAKMPHLLVAGTTGSGKSVGVNAMILSMLYKSTPDDVRFIMIDPKMLELSVYEGIPHLLTEVVTDMKDAANALRWCVGEMERRYKLMSALGVRNLAGYNDRVKEAEDMGRPIPDPFWKPSDGMAIEPPMLEKLPYIVVMVDEFADLMMTVGKKVEELIARLAQKARAAGIHLVLATQRPSVDVITGLIKANIPTRIAFTVSSKIDSRTILDQGGAESLLGMGDMLYMAPNSSIPVRVHGAFVRDQEVHAVVQDWKARGRPQYIDNIISGGDEGEGGSLGLDDGEELDPLFDQAVLFVVEKRRASISGVQRQFRIGYNRAARIVEQMEAQSIVSAPGHNGNREVLAPPPHE